MTSRNLVFDRLEYLLGHLYARAGGSADVKLDLSAIDDREKISTDKKQRKNAKRKHEDCGRGNDNLVS